MQELQQALPKESILPASLRLQPRKRPRLQPQRLVKHLPPRGNHLLRLERLQRRLQLRDANR